MTSQQQSVLSGDRMWPAITFPRPIKLGRADGEGELVEPRQALRKCRDREPGKRMRGDPLHGGRSSRRDVPSGQAVWGQTSRSMTCYSLFWSPESQKQTWALGG